MGGRIGLLYVRVIDVDIDPKDIIAPLKRDSETSVLKLRALFLVNASQSRNRMLPSRNRSLIGRADSTSAFSRISGSGIDAFKYR